MVACREVRVCLEAELPVQSRGKAHTLQLISQSIKMFTLAHSSIFALHTIYIA